MIFFHLKSLFEGLTFTEISLKLFFLADQVDKGFNLKCHKLRGSIDRFQLRGDSWGPWLFVVNFGDYTNSYVGNITSSNQFTLFFVG